MIPVSPSEFTFTHFLAVNCFALKVEQIVIIVAHFDFAKIHRRVHFKRLNNEVYTMSVLPQFFFFFFLTSVFKAF